MSKDTLPNQSTTLEALLRGEGLDKRNNSKNDEESLLEIQVRSVTQVVANTAYMCLHWLRVSAKCLKCECSAISLKPLRALALTVKFYAPTGCQGNLPSFSG